MQLRRSAPGDARSGCCAMWRYKGMCVVIVVVCVLASTAIGFLLTPGRAPPRPSPSRHRARTTCSLRAPPVTPRFRATPPSAPGSSPATQCSATWARAWASTISTSSATSSRSSPSSDSTSSRSPPQGPRRAMQFALATEVTRPTARETEKRVNDLTDAALRSIDEKRVRFGPRSPAATPRSTRQRRRRSVSSSRRQPPSVPRRRSSATVWSSWSTPTSPR